MMRNFLEAEEHGFSPDQRAELGLGALVCVVVLVLLAMLAFILKEAWPSFAHNGLRWFGAGGNVDNQIQAIFTSGDQNQAPQLLFHAWPLIWSTILTTGFAVVISFVCSLFVAVFNGRVRAGLAEAHPGAGGPAAGERAVGHLRAARGAGAGAVHRQPPESASRTRHR